MSGRADGVTHNSGGFSHMGLNVNDAPAPALPQLLPQGVGWAWGPSGDLGLLTLSGK